MKKHIITAVLAVSIFAPSATFAQVSQATSSPAMFPPASIAPNRPLEPMGRPTLTCGAFVRNMAIGAKNLGNDAQVTLLQELLQKYGYFKVGPTGYFGTVTLKAVKDYQRAEGLPPTGFVGVLTRARMNASLCKGPAPVPVSINVTAPKGGEVLKRNATMTITWTDSNTYIQAPKYDVKLQQDLGCKPDQPCIALYPIPMTIAKNVMDTKTTWKVGEKFPSNTMESLIVPDGSYNVFVCPAGKSDMEDLLGCAKSASFITITTATSTTQ